MKTLWNLLVTLAFVTAFGMLFLRWLAQGGGTLPYLFSSPLPERRGETAERGTLRKVFLAALLFRLAVAVGSLLFYGLLSGNALELAEIPGLWTRWDALHYIRLAELGYGGYLENGEPLFLVFFPLYVWLMRAAALIIPHTATAGMLVSWLCFAWGNVYLYRLVSEEYGVPVARRTLLLLWAFPFSFFFGGIMTESLFLLTTTAGLYFIRRHQWERAAFWGVLAAMTRMQGVLLTGVACAEIFYQVKPLAVHGEERRTAFLKIGRQLPLLLAPLLGSLAYFGLNAYVAGSPFAFTKMQEHWSQGFQWLPEVLAYLGKNALTWENPVTRWEMWIPELLLFPLFALLLCRSWRKHRSMFTLYAFVYFILNYCLSWLLSAGRYLSCATPCFFFAADELEGHPRLTKFLALAMVLLQCIFCYRYLCWGQVM